MPLLIATQILAVNIKQVAFFATDNTKESNMKVRIHKATFAGRSAVG